MRSVPAFKTVEQIVWDFSFLSRKHKFYPFSWKSICEQPWLLPVCFPHAYEMLKPEVFMEYHCSEEPWETSGGDIPGDCPTSGLEVASPQGRASEGEKPDLLSSCSSSQPKPQKKVDLC